MAGAFLDLQQVLRVRKVKLTLEEENILQSCAFKSFNDFTGSALVGGTAVWAATWKLSKTCRILFSAGAGFYCGLWMFGRSMYSCVDRILTLDGSILQRELANIMVTKYQHDPSLMRLVSKHFYLERVFDDSTSYNPKLRWRSLNLFSDNVVHGHDHDSDNKSQGDSRNDSHNNFQGESENVTDSKGTNVETKHEFIKAGPDIMAEQDPLDCIFGYGAPVEETRGLSTPNKPSGAHTWGHRRIHRRRRMRNHEELSNSEHAAVV